MDIEKRETVLTTGGRGVLAEPFMGGIVGGAVSEGGCEMTGWVEVYGREEGGVLRGEGR